MSGCSHDFIIDLATSLPDIRDNEIEPSTMSWGLNLDFLDDEIEDTMTTSNELNLDHVKDRLLWFEVDFVKRLYFWL